MDVLKYSTQLFDKCRERWESENSLRILSVTLVVTFLTCSLLSFLVIHNYINLFILNTHFLKPFFAIEVVFTMLLITELLGLIFILPESVSKSIVKQFELLSLILLRDGFKEFSHLNSSFEWSEIQQPLTHMIVYGFGGIIIFVLIGFIYKTQRHIRLTGVEDDQKQFIKLKKILSLLMLLTFAVFGINDLKTLVTTGAYHASFHTLYTVLIFSDIIIILIALRYTLNYYKIFRYSGFMLATILIRVSLSIDYYYNVAIGVLAAIFVLMLTLAYNYFLKDPLNQK